MIWANSKRGVTVQLSLFLTHYRLNRKENTNNRSAWVLICFVYLLEVFFLVACGLLGFLKDLERFLK